MWAAANGSETTAQLLLDNDTRVDGTYESPTATAAENCHEAVSCGC